MVNLIVDYFQPRATNRADEEILMLFYKVKNLNSANAYFNTPSYLNSNPNRTLLTILHPPQTVSVLSNELLDMFYFSNSAPSVYYNKSTCFTIHILKKAEFSFSIDDFYLLYDYHGTVP